MTINREAAEQMAAHLTSTIRSAVDVADTFNEALRLATVALQEARQVPEVEPGTVGTATVEGRPAIRGTWIRSLNGSAYFATHEAVTSTGNLAHSDNVTAFIPDPDAAALRAEVERLTAALAEANDARAAMLTENARLRERIGFLEAVEERKAQFDQSFGQERESLIDRLARAEARLARVRGAWGEYRRNLGGSIPEHYRDQMDAALVAADEQAAEVRPELITVPYDGHGDDVTCPDCPHSTSHHDPIACGDPSCDC